MQVCIHDIACSTAKITISVAGAIDQYEVCYWYGENTQKKTLQWVGLSSGMVYMLNKPCPIDHLLPLFQALCDANADKFTDHVCGKK
jgi:hypothetical protein